MKRCPPHFEMNISCGELREHRKLTDCVLMRLIKVGTSRSAVCTSNVKYSLTGKRTRTHVCPYTAVRAQLNIVDGRLLDCLICLMKRLAN